MTTVSGQLTETLQTLVDSRLDTVDRMLLGRVPRRDRLAIVREVESQIFELLQERDSEELGRDDVLAVLARLDPPEAYLPDEFEGETWASRRPSPAALPARKVKTDPRLARASGILGIIGTALVLLSPLIYLGAAAFESVPVAVVVLVIALGTMFVAGVLGLALGVYARRGGAWAVTGIVTGAISLVFSLAGGVLFLAELVSS